MKFVKKLIMLAMVLTLVLTSMATVAMADGTDGTITLTNAAIGEDYQAYKILDATYDGDKIAYTTTTPELFSATGSPWVVQETADASGNYNVQLAENMDIDDVNTWITANLSSFTAINPTSGVGTDNKTATASTVEWSGLAYGYYYITSGLGSTVTINSVDPDAEVIDKNDTNPSSLLKVSDSTTAQIGDVVKFTVTFTATNYVTDTDSSNVTTTEKITEYSFFDEADGFDYLVDTSHPVTVQIGERTATEANATYTQQTDTAVGTMTFVIDWVDDEDVLLYNHSENVTVTYYGVVNAYAQDGSAVNGVEVKYNDDGAAVSGQTVTTTTATYSLTINKTDGTNPLTGAKFKLHRTSATAAAMQLISITVANPADDTVYFRVAETGETGAVDVIDMTEASSAVIYGLDGADTYYIEETEAPKGYNKLTDAQGQAMDNTNVEVEIENVEGVLLPSTGGMGTTLFYVLGGLMVVGALVILVTNKRMRSR